MKKRKPKAWEWSYGIIILVLAFFREPVMKFAVRLPPFLTYLLDFVTDSPGIGIGWCIGLFIVRAAYADLPPEEQREADRRNTDERNIAIRGKAAYICLNMTWLILVGFMLLLDYRGHERESLWCGTLTLVSIFAFPLLEYWYNKRM